MKEAVGFPPYFVTKRGYVTQFKVYKQISSEGLIGKFLLLFKSIKYKKKLLTLPLFLFLLT